MSDLVKNGPEWQTWLNLNVFETLPSQATDASSTIINSIRNHEKGLFLTNVPLIHNFHKSSAKNILCPGCKSKISRNSVTCTYCLTTAHQSCAKSCKDCSGLGMMYIEAHYEESTVLPMKMYDSLIDFLFQDNFAFPSYLEKPNEDRDEMLDVMVRDDY